MSPMKILTVDFKAKEAPEQLADSLNTTGFAIISHHPIPLELTNKVYQEWTQFFESKQKHDYTFNPETQSGYFPFQSENAKDSPVKDLKEFYHLYPQEKLPPNFSKATIELRDHLLGLGQQLLRWIDLQTPPEIRARFSMPLDQMIEGSKKNLFRIIHYPPLTGSEQDGAIRAAAHEDINLITLLPASTAMGLQVRNRDGDWFEVPGGFGDIVVNVGDMLQMASEGYYRSTTHQVINPSGPETQKPRYSMPLFLHPHPEVRLSETHTADQYLRERLAEIGLA